MKTLHNASQFYFQTNFRRIQKVAIAKENKQKIKFGLRTNRKLRPKREKFSNS